jgi:hypothetical protein
MTKLPDRLSDKISWDLEKGLAKHGEESMGLVYEVLPLAAQAPGQPSPQVAAMLVTVWAKSALIGQLDVVSITLQNPQAATPEQLDDACRQIAEQLRQKRSSDLAGLNGSADTFPQGPPLGLVP